MMIQDFCDDFDVPIYVVGIDDVGKIDNFAEYTIKKTKHELNYKFEITPQNTLVLCSTPVLEMYKKIGYTILPAELLDSTNYSYKAETPWQIVEKIAHHQSNWDSDDEIITKIHPSSYTIWKRYGIGERTKLLFSDMMIGDDGDLTETRDYNSYVRQMDEIATLKYNETLPYIKKGRIGDIGCAVGSWIKLASNEDKFHESDFYGIEVARALFDLCIQRKNNKEFGNPNVFFAQKNAVEGIVFQPNSINTIHTSSLTHEIESYGGRKNLLKFIKNRFAELTMGGVWINRDVVAPDNKESYIYMKLNRLDGNENDINKIFNDRGQLKEHLDSLSTFGRFLRFASDFRKDQQDRIDYKIEKINDEEYIYIKLKDCSEFISKKDYTDNWESEMHETFCFWDFNEWKSELQKVGFKIDKRSYCFTNPWIVQNRFVGKVELFRLQNGTLKPIDYPVTNMILIGEK